MEQNEGNETDGTKENRSFLDIIAYKEEVSLDRKYYRGKGALTIVFDGKGKRKEGTKVNRQ